MKFRVPFLLLFSVLCGWTAFGEPTDVLIVKITPQVVESDQSVTWEQPLTRSTRPGVPVVVKIDAESLFIRVTVTPFVRGSDFLLVVQGDVKQVGERGNRRSSTLQSLLVPPGEPIAFFPLGREPGDSGRQMVVMMSVEFPRE